ncbi:MAG: hypothetical protein WCG04_05895, partial [Alphaproteobacteria bacterium]
HRESFRKSYRPVPSIPVLMGTGQQENRALAYARCYFLASGMTVGGDAMPLSYPELRLSLRCLAE